MFDTHLYHVSLGEKENGYRKYFHYLSESLEFAEHGQIYLLVQIDDYFHADILAKEMFDAFKSTYYQDLDQEPLVSLEDSLKELNHLIESKIQNDRIAISAVAAAVDGEKMYVSSVGQAELYLYRDQQLLPVLENIEVPESFGYVSSGFLEDTDTVFFATKPLLDVISFENFSRIFATPSPMVQKLHTFKEVVQPAEDSSMDMLVLECFIDDYDDSVMSEYFQKGKEWFSRFTEASGSIEIPDHHKEKAANMASEIGSGVTKWLKSGLSSVLSSVTGATGKAGNFGETVGSLGEKVGNINMDEVKDIHNKTKRLHRNVMVKLQESVSHFSGNKNMFVVFVMLVLIGISAIGYAGYNYQQQNAMLDEVYVQVDEMKDNLERAKMRIIYDKKGAQKLLVQLQKDINAIIDMGLPIDLDDLAVDIQENLDKAANIARVNPEAIASLENVRADVDLRGFENIGGQMIAYDYNAYYSVVLDEVNTIKVSDNADMIASTYFDDQSSVLFYSQDKSIWELKNGALTTLSTTDDVFKNAVAFDDFRQYVYFLDPESNQIWKYMRNNSGFAGAVEYNQGTDLSRATDIAIDGHIYISTQDGNIIKMLSAQQIPFEFSNLPEKILVIDKIETTVDSDYLYILISDEKKIIKVTKDGDYRKEYVFEIDESLVDLHIDENSGKLFVLSTSYLYSINL